MTLLLPTQCSASSSKIVLPKLHDYAVLIVRGCLLVISCIWLFFLEIILGFWDGDTLGLQCRVCWCGFAQNQCMTVVSPGKSHGVVGCRELASSSATCFLTLVAYFAENSKQK